MKKLSYIILPLLFLMFWGCSGSDNETIAQQNKGTTEQLEKPNVEVVWMKFDDGIEKGVKEKKNIVVDFYTDWCHWCKVMDEKTFRNKDVAKKLSDRFVTVRLNAESRTEKLHFQGKEFTNMELTRYFRVSGFPSIAFISPEKEVITVIPGYIPAEQFGYLLDYIDKECYKKKISLEEYIKKKGNCEETKAN